MLETSPDFASQTACALEDVLEADCFDVEGNLVWIGPRSGRLQREEDEERVASAG